MAKSKIVKKFKRKDSIRCLYGSCNKCSRKDKIGGIHDIMIYQIYELTEKTMCKDCEGIGSKTETCWNCNGTGEEEETCGTCNGDKLVFDGDGSEDYVKEVALLVSKEK